MKKKYVIWRANPKYYHAKEQKPKQYLNTDSKEWYSCCSKASRFSNHAEALHNVEILPKGIYGIEIIYIID